MGLPGSRRLRVLPIVAVILHFCAARGTPLPGRVARVPWGPHVPICYHPVLAPLVPGGGGRSRTSRSFCSVCFGANSLILKI